MPALLAGWTKLPFSGTRVYRRRLLIQSNPLKIQFPRSVAPLMPPTSSPVAKILRSTLLKYERGTHTERWIIGVPLPSTHLHACFFFFHSPPSPIFSLSLTRKLRPTSREARSRAECNKAIEQRTFSLDISFEFLSFVNWNWKSKRQRRGGGRNEERGWKAEEKANKNEQLEDFFSSKKLLSGRGLISLIREYILRNEIFIRRFSGILCFPSFFPSETFPRGTSSFRYVFVCVWG